MVWEKDVLCLTFWSLEKGEGKERVKGEAERMEEGEERGKERERVGF